MSKEDRYNINVNRPPVKKEDINKYKDFNRIISKHKSITKRSPFKQRRIYFFILLALIIGYLIYLSEKEKGLPQKEQTQEQIDK